MALHANRAGYTQPPTGAAVSSGQGGAQRSLMDGGPSAADDRDGVSVGDAAESGRSPQGRFGEPEPQDRLPVNGRPCAPAIDPELTPVSPIWLPPSCRSLFTSPQSSARSCAGRSPTTWLRHGPLVRVVAPKGVGHFAIIGRPELVSGALARIFTQSVQIEPTRSQRGRQAPAEQKRSGVAGHQYWINAGRSQVPMSKKLAAEFIGTFWLVLGGCGSAVLAAAFPEVGIGLAGVSLAFGLTVLTMAYAIGHISGCHLNPAVTVGLWACGPVAAIRQAKCCPTSWPRCWAALQAPSCCT